AGARDAAGKALKTLDEIKKPDNVSDADFAKSKQPYIIFFNNTGAQASVLLKDYSGAMSFYKAVLSLNPDEPVTHYNMGKAYMAMNPTSKWTRCGTSPRPLRQRRQQTRRRNNLRRI